MAEVKKSKKRTAPPKPINPFIKLRRRRYHVQTVELTGRLLKETWGNIAATARLLGLTREAVSLYITQHPELKAILNESRQITVDCSEWQLRDAIWAGEPWAIKLVLETLGRDRGYVRGMQVGGQPNPDGTLGPVPVQFFLPENGRPFRTPEAITNGEIVTDGPASVVETLNGDTEEIRDNGSE